MQEQNENPLIETNGKMSFCLSNLIITGCATPFLQNGVVRKNIFLCLK